MNKQIKEIVEYYQVDRKRQEHLDIKNEMFHLEWLMNHMALNREVGMYAFKLDEYAYLISTIDKSSERMKEKAYICLMQLPYEIRELEKVPEVLAYSQVRSKYNELKEKISEYAKTINIDFRKEISKYPLPDIFVLQKDNAINIVNPQVFLSSENDVSLLSPVYELESKREYRHFYNRVSFAYLEEMTLDCDYSLKNKNLGKEKIKKM